MSSHLLTPEQYGRESSIDSEATYVQDRNDYDPDHMNKRPSDRGRPLWLAFSLALLLLPLRLFSKVSAGRVGLARRPAIQRLVPRLAHRRGAFLFRLCLGTIISLLIVFGTFRPSYTCLPPHYKALQQNYMESNESGRGNAFKEQVFISCALYDKNGHLASGAWGRTILDLVDVLGHENVFLSIYENDSGEAGANALAELKSKVQCDHEIVSELQVPADPFPTIVLPDHTERHKRIPYLAEMRNRALRPLDNYSNRTYDKVLILNDVFFNPLDAAQLLFSTHLGPDGKAEYLAACAVDFINPMKFYDTYATRDLDGYSMGVPFFPWFSSAGRGQSRRDVLDQTDAVRVKSCWGGMVAFDAKYLQSFMTVIPQGFHEIGHHTIVPTTPKNVSAPVRFRAEPEIYFDACECCLLLADIIQVASPSEVENDTRVYLNPYVRVAYDPTTLSWLGFTRRFERLYSLPHWLVTVLARLPTYNPHRTAQEGDHFQEEVWTGDSTETGSQHWQIENRIARNGLYCGVREMQVLLQEKRTRDKNWENTPIPSGGHLW